MPTNRDETELSQLALLADGTLTGERADAARARVQADPELSTLLAEQERAVAALRALEHVVAPASLHASVREQLAAAERRGPRRLFGRGGPRRARFQPRRRARFQPRRRLAFGGAGALALAVAAALVIALVPGSGPTAPTVARAAALTIASSTLAAPQRDAARPRALTAAVQGVAFPYWDDISWRSAGERHDTLGGRHVTTVYYWGLQEHRRIGYSIWSGGPLHVAGGSTVVHHGVTLHVLRIGSRELVTWLRDGHTCILSGAGVPASTLLTLAGTPDPGVT